MVNSTGMDAKLKIVFTTTGFPLFVNVLGLRLVVLTIFNVYHTDLKFSFSDTSCIASFCLQLAAIVPFFL